MTSNPRSLQAEIAAEMLRASREGPPTVACTVISAPDGLGLSLGDKLLVRADGSSLGALSQPALQAVIVREAVEAIPRHTVATFAFTPGGARLHGRRAIEAAAGVVEVLLEVLEPAATLLVVGGGHVGRSVAELGALLGLSVVVLDDREDYASVDRFPFADQVICGDFATELARLPITPSTFVVLVSRGHKVDQLSLRQVIDRDPAYLGMIGSKRRTRTVLEHLAAEGVDAARLARVFTPIGLDIGAETPAEIALAVLAEIVLLRRGGSGRPLSPRGREIAGG